ncbi:MAG: DUF4097 family beta strand repeat-containing protein [Halobacteria archaeon]
MERRKFIITTGAVGATGLSGCILQDVKDAGSGGEREEVTEKKTYTVGEKTELNVQNDAGTIDIETHSGDKVEAEYEYKAPSKEDAKALSVEKSGDKGSFTLEAKYPDGAENRSIEMDLKVPDDYSPNSIRNNAGDIEIEIPNLRNDAKIKTDAGGIDASLAKNLNAKVTASTNAGSIEIDDLDIKQGSGVAGGSAEGTLGNGDNKLKLTSDAGTIELDALD